MKIFASILALILMVVVAWCSQVHNSSVLPQPSAIDQLKVGNDGTATVTGDVLENHHGCEVDGACYLKLQVGTRTVQVIYHPGDVEGHVNAKAANDGAGVRKGDRVEAYGAYNKSGDADMIDVYSADSYYIRVLPR